ncbi:MAG: GHMP kinase, partial [Selenomonas sp.]|nr:GHMP kinase [Selenomonas sp.]
MKIVVRVPGSCGELVQGWSEGNPFLGTCPINKYTTVEVSSDFSGRYGLGEKSLLALSLTLSRLGKTDFPYGIRLTSELPRGKGMASSSADIAAVVVAVMEILGQPWTEQFIMDIATAIEPTDGVFCPGIVLMNHITGQVLAGYRQVPALQAAVFDLGGTVNTCELHAQVIVDKSKIDSQAMAA